MGLISAFRFAIPQNAFVVWFALQHVLVLCVTLVLHLILHLLDSLVTQHVPIFNLILRLVVKNAKIVQQNCLIITEQNALLQETAVN
jgi:hypothetical protein